MQAPLTASPKQPIPGDKNPAFITEESKAFSPFSAWKGGPKCWNLRSYVEDSTILEVEFYPPGNHPLPSQALLKMISFPKVGFVGFLEGNQKNSRVAVTRLIIWIHLDAAWHVSALPDLEYFLALLRKCQQEEAEELRKA